MAKSIIKEIIIMLLLCVAILLILGILFYDYIPTNKVIPTKEAYQTPEEVKNELSEEVTEMEKTEVSYEITDADLNIYKQSKSYNPGKKDPFANRSVIANATSTQQAAGEETGEKNDDNDNTGDSEQKTDTPKKDKDSTGTFFDDEGLK